MNSTLHASTARHSQRTFDYSWHRYRHTLQDASTCWTLGRQTLTTRARELRHRARIDLVPRYHSAAIVQLLFRDELVGAISMRLSLATSTSQRCSTSEFVARGDARHILQIWSPLAPGLGKPPPFKLSFPLPDTQSLILPSTRGIPAGSNNDSHSSRPRTAGSGSLRALPRSFDPDSLASRVLSNANPKSFWTG
jgi:hypothetical protein